MLSTVSHCQLSCALVLLQRSWQVSVADESQAIEPDILLNDIFSKSVIMIQEMLNVVKHKHVNIQALNRYLQAQIVQIELSFPTCRDP